MNSIGGRYIEGVPIDDDGLFLGWMNADDYRLSAFITFKKEFLPSSGIDKDTEVHHRRGVTKSHEEFVLISESKNGGRWKHSFKSLRREYWCRRWEDLKHRELRCLCYDD